jgi:hypothetical protein
MLVDWNISWSHCVVALCRSRENPRVLALSPRVPVGVPDSSGAASCLLCHLHFLPGCSTQLSALHNVRRHIAGRHVPAGSNGQLCGTQLFRFEYYFTGTNIGETHTHTHTYRSRIRLTQLTLQSPVVTIRATRFNTLTNPTFCPHSVFMCFVWIWE